MLRFIIKRQISDRYSELKSEHLETILVECKELEDILLRGGVGMNEYDHSSLVGVELVNNAGLSPKSMIE